LPARLLWTLASPVRIRRCAGGDKGRAHDFTRRDCVF
jgi:hypothetical protein